MHLKYLIGLHLSLCSLCLWFYKRDSIFQIFVSYLFNILSPFLQYIFSLFIDLDFLEGKLL